MASYNLSCQASQIPHEWGSLQFSAFGIAG